MPLRLPIITGSRLDLGERCAPSVVLPWADDLDNEAARLGRVKHRFVEAVRTLGRDAALAELTDDDPARPVCEALDVDAIPSGAESEVALAWSWQTGRARKVGVGLGRNYSGVRADEIAATADLLGIVGERVWVPDLKTGWQPPRVEDSLQLSAEAVMAAKVAGVDSAEISILHWRADGTLRASSLVLDAFDLAEVEERLRQLVARIIAANAALEAGRVPDFTTGAHCSYCPALRFCPAQMGLVRAFVGAVAERSAVLAQLPADVAAEALRAQYDAMPPEALGQMHVMREGMLRVLDIVGDAIRAAARQRPLVLPDGRRVAEVVVEKDDVIDEHAAAVLRDEVGEAFVARAVDTRVKVSKASVGRAMQACGTKEGRKPLRVRAVDGQLLTKDDIIERLRAAGAVRKTRYTKLDVIPAEKSE